MIDDELRADLAEEEEDQIINGSGSGENLTGILATSGIQNQAWTTDLLTTIRKAKTKTRTVGRVAPNGFVVNPEDAERLDLLKGTSNDYFYGPGPFAAAGIRTVWGVPIVESEAVAASRRPSPPPTRTRTSSSATSSPSSARSASRSVSRVRRRSSTSI
jgi:HK97 family phage major capsid protein